MSRTRILFLISALATFSHPLPAVADDVASPITNVAFVNPDIAAPSDEEMRETIVAVAHLRTSKTARAILDRFSVLRTHVTVVINHQHVVEYHTIGNFVAWDPSVALRNPDGSELTPSLVLLHELAHALDANEFPKKHLRACLTPEKTYDNLEEMRVIRYVENPAARELREGIRHTHSGHIYASIATDSTQESTTPAFSIAETLGSAR